MKIKNKMKSSILTYLFSLLPLSLAIANHADSEINHILRIHGPIFLRTSEKFAPEKMEYLLSDTEGNAYNIEGNPVKLTLSGIENFHGEFIPAKTFLSKSGHQFVGHVNLPANGEIKISIGENEKFYPMPNHDETVKDTIKINTSIYEISIEFSKKLRKDVLFENDVDTARAMTYFIEIEEFKWISHTPEHATFLQNIKENEEKEAIIQAAFAKAEVDAQKRVPNFKGAIRSNRFLNGVLHELISVWDAIDCPNITSYRIYNGNAMVKEILATQRFYFQTRLQSAADATGFSITSVNSIGRESVRSPITIIF